MADSANLGFLRVGVLRIRSLYIWGPTISVLMLGISHMRTFVGAQGPQYNPYR